MRSCWRGVTTVAMDDDHASRPFRADLIVEDDRITEVRERFGANGQEYFDRVVEADRLVVVPGYVNAHVHSWEAFFKGRYDNLPLELWMLRSYPLIGLEPMPTELVRLRTLLVALESLKNGVTCLLDDVIEMPGQSLEALDAVMSAYEECGIRANCSGNIVNKPFIDTLPFVDEVLPDELLEKLRSGPVPSTEDYLEFSREAFRRYHGRSGRLRYVIAPSGPQRCTDDLLLAAHDLAAEWDATYHIHVLETRVQAVTGQEFYGSTLVAHMARVGALSDRVTLGHGIWLTLDDIACLSDAGASIAHNPVSNLKLDSGLLAWRDLHNAEVNVALGTDGASSNDSLRMSDVMKTAALIHKVTSPRFERGPTADEVLFAATRAGARSARLSQTTGQIAPGFKADLVFYDRDALAFTPDNDIVRQLVYCEGGDSIREVVVDGRTVVRDGICLTIDEPALLAEIRAATPALLREHEAVEQANLVLEPYLRAIYERSWKRDVGVERLASGTYT
ncbi:MAG: amidohydrolase family protein [Acidimicrobiales bacterium]